MLSLELECTVSVPRAPQPAVVDSDLPVRIDRRRRVTGVHFALRLGPKAPGGRIDFDVHLVYE